MLVGQLVDAVKVGVQAQAQATQHQDGPLVHARAAQLGGDHFGLAVDDLRRQDVLDDLEDLVPQAIAAIDVLEAEQDQGDVVPRAHVDLDVGDVDLADGLLAWEGVSHEFSLSFGWFGRARPVGVDGTFSIVIVFQWLEGFGPAPLVGCGHHLHY